MAYIDYSSHWVLDQFLTYLEANVLGSNDKHIVDSFSVEHNWNPSIADGTHKTNSITGSMINTTPASTGSQIISDYATWTPTVGIYQLVISTPITFAALQLYISGSWRTADAQSGDTKPFQGIFFFDGTNMRILNDSPPVTVWYQKF